MKKKFIFLAMMLLTLIGGGKILRAQEVVTIGDGGSNNARLPINTYASYGYSQQIFSQDEVNHGPGEISKIKFFLASEYSVSRNLKIYMINTDRTTFSGNSDYETVTDSDVVYDGVVSYGSSFEVTFTKNFEYSGGNILLCVEDYTGEAPLYTYFMTNTKSEYVAISGTSSSRVTPSNTPYGYTRSFNNQVELTFEVADGLEPAVPTGLTAEALNHKSVSLTWDAAENALKYNVYRDGAKIGSTSETSYTDNTCSAETSYSYTVTGVRGSKESESSVAASVTTLEYTDPFAGKQFRIKVNDGNYAGKYLNVKNYYGSGGTSTVGIADYQESNMQIFTIEGSGYGQYYLKSADGYYVVCEIGSSWWGVHANSTTNKTPLEFEYTDNDRFYIKDYHKMTGYSQTGNDGDGYFFKVENNLVYCDAPEYYETQSGYGPYSYITTWTIEEVAPKAPNAPVLTAEAQSTTSIRLSWDAVYGAESYTVYEGETVLAENITDTYYLHEGLTASTTYTYTVTATNEIGTSEKSNEASATTWAPAPETAPTNLAYSDLTYNSLTLSWDAVTNANYYIVNVADANGNVIQYTAYSTSYTVTDLAEETEYTFTVIAANESGVSSDSEALTVTTLKFEGRTVVFELQDKYGDGWNYNQLYVTFSDGTPSEYLTLNNGYSYDSKEYNLPYGTEVTVTYILYTYSSSWPEENAYYIRYKDDNSLIYQDGYTVTGNAPSTETYTFTVEQPGPANVVATPNQIFTYQTTTLTWDAFEGAASYNIYVNGDLKANTAELTYELSELPYGNVTIAVAAADAEGKEISGKTNCTVTVAGTFTLAINVKDEFGNPIEGAEVTIDLSVAFDEFQNMITEVDDVEPTDAEGNTTVTLPLLYKNYMQSGYSYIYPQYNVIVSKSPYMETNRRVYYSEISNGVTLNVELSLTLPSVSGLQFTVEGNTVYSVKEDAEVELTWSELEGATAYNVYKDGELLEDGTALTANSYSFYAEYTETASVYAVTALFEGDIETGKTEAYLSVYGDGFFKGIVTDGANPVEGVKYVLTGTNALDYEDKVHAEGYTNENGEFEGQALVDGTYTLTFTHSSYEQYVFEVPADAISYNNTNDLGTFALTAKPVATISNVTATAEGDYANVSWTGDYAKYNVYRRPANTQDITTLQEGHTTTSYSDADWASLEPGSYQYGVSTFVEQGGATRSEEYQINEGFENSPEPEGWEGNDHWYQGAGRNAESQYSSYGIYTGWVGYKHYLVTPMINTSGAVLSFYYWIDESYGAGDALDVYYSTESQSGSWSESIFNTTTSGGEWEYAEILLSDYISESQVYIAFCQTEDINGGGNGLMIDDVKVTSGAPAVTETETAIVWSDAIEKQGPNTFEGTLNAYWDTPANWSHGAVPADGEDVVIAANAAIANGNVNVANLTINSGVSLTVGTSTSLTVTGKIAQEDAYSLILNEGGQIFQNNEGVTATFTKNFEKPSSWTNDNTEGWQFISMPLEGVSYTDFTTSEDADEEYDLYKYNASEDLEWQNYKENDFSETQFVSGTGYLAARKNATAVNFHGTLYNGTSWSKTLVSAYNDDSEIKNISLVGNPFTFNIKWSELYETSYSSYTDMYYVVNGYATVQDGEIAYSVEDEIKVGQGFMVKATAGYAGFSNFTPTKAAVATRSSRQSADVLNVIASGKAGKDNVVIRLAGESEGFPKLQNFNEDIANVYVANEGVRYGIVNVNEDVQEVELSFHAKEMGNYTINAIPSGEFESVTLVDKLTGAETNLLLEGYTFTATSNDNDNRFVIRLAVSGQQSANSNFVYQSGEDLIIDAEGTVQIIDVMGRIIFSDDVESTNGRVSVSDYKAGTYMVRVINGSEVKVEKVVIY